MKKRLQVSSHTASDTTPAITDATWDSATYTWDDANAAWDGGPTYVTSDSLPMGTIKKELDNLVINIERQSFRLKGSS